MKRWLSLICLLPGLCRADVSQRLNMTSQDATVNTYPYKAIFSNGSITDNNDGTVSITSSGGGSTVLTSSGIAFGSGANAVTSDTNTLRYTPGIGFFASTATISSGTINILNVGVPYTDKSSTPMFVTTFPNGTAGGGTVPNPPTFLLDQSPFDSSQLNYFPSALRLQTGTTDDQIHQGYGLDVEMANVANGIGVYVNNTTSNGTGGSIGMQVYSRGNVVNPVYGYDAQMNGSSNSFGFNADCGINDCGNTYSVKGVAHNEYCPFDHNSYGSAYGGYFDAHTTASMVPGGTNIGLYAVAYGGTRNFSIWTDSAPVQINSSMTVTNGISASSITVNSSGPTNWDSGSTYSSAQVLVNNPSLSYIPSVQPTSGLFVGMSIPVTQVTTLGSSGIHAYLVDNSTSASGEVLRTEVFTTTNSANLWGITTLAECSEGANGPAHDCSILVNELDAYNHSTGTIIHNGLMIPAERNTAQAKGTSEDGLRWDTALNITNLHWLTTSGVVPWAEGIWVQDGIADRGLVLGAASTFTVTGTMPIVMISRQAANKVSFSTITTDTSGNILVSTTIVITGGLQVSSITALSSATVSTQLVLPVAAGTLPSTGGDLRYDSTDDGLRTYNGILKSTVSMPTVIYSSVSYTDVLVSTTITTTETAFANNFVFPANFWTVGKKVLVNLAHEWVATATIPTSSLKLRFEKSGPVDVPFAAGITIARVASAVWIGDGETILLTCTATGASGTMSAFIVGPNPNVGGITRNTLSQPITFDTTVAQTMQVTLTYGASSNSNLTALRGIFLTEMN